MKRFAALLLLIASSACLDVTGLQEVVDQTLLQGVVGSVQCPDTIRIGEVGQCQAYNSLGTIITAAEGGFLPGQGWDATPDSVLAINFLGEIQGLLPGDATVIGNGVQFSSASQAVTVILP